jgi:hypothetical protein
MAPKKMGRPPTGKPRFYVRLPENLWRSVDLAAAKNHRTRDLQIEAILSDWLAQDAPRQGELEDDAEEGGPRAHDAKRGKLSR